MKLIATEEVLHLLPRVADAIKYAKGGISAYQVSKQLQMPVGQQNTARGAISWIKSKGWLDTAGSGRSLVYAFNDSYKDQLNPNNPDNILGEIKIYNYSHPGDKAVDKAFGQTSDGERLPQIKVAKPIAQATAPRIVEIGHSCLKVLVKQVMEDNPHPEGPLQHAIMKALMLLV